MPGASEREAAKANLGARAYALRRAEIALQEPAAFETEPVDDG